MLLKACMIFFSGVLATTVADTDGIVKKDLGLTPDALVREYVQRDANGQFLRTDEWWNTANECPGCMGGPDTHEVISGFTIKRISELEYTVSYDVEGSLARQDFVAKKSSRVVPFSVVKTEWGYKLRRRAYQMVSAKFICDHKLSTLTPASAAKLQSLCH